MRRLLVLLSVAAVGLACSDGTPLQPDLASGPELTTVASAGVGARLVHMVPLKMKGTFTSYLSSDPNACAAYPGAVGFVIDYAGTSSHLGLTTGLATNCVVIGSDGSRTFMAQTATTVAANGDLLYAHGSAAADGTSIVYAADGSWTLGPVPLRGGTGRLVNATGYWILSGPDPLGGPYKATGQISSVGSSK